MIKKPSCLFTALLMIPVLASACDAVCQRMQRQQQRDMNYQMHLQETQRIQGQYNQGYSAPAPTYYPRYGVVVQGIHHDATSSDFRADGYPSSAMAENVALTRCRNAGLKCHVIFNYQNGCFALAKGVPFSERNDLERLFSGLHERSRWKAKHRAMQNCKANATNCQPYGGIECSLPSKTPY